MVPIFRRRKRPRQAFYAQPSQDCNNKIEKENIQQDFGGNSRQRSYQKAPTYELLGLDNNNMCDEFNDNISEFPSDEWLNVSDWEDTNYRLKRQSEYEPKSRASVKPTLQTMKKEPPQSHTR